MTKIISYDLNSMAISMFNKTVMHETENKPAIKYPTTTVSELLNGYNKYAYLLPIKNISQNTVRKVLSGLNKKYKIQNHNLKNGLGCKANLPLLITWVM